MTIEEAFRARLLSRPAVTDLVGDRIAQGLAVQGDPKPFVSYDLDGGDRNYHTKGVSSLTTARFDIRCVADSLTQARQVYEAIRDAVDGFSGHWEDVEIDSAFLEPPTQARDRPKHGRERPIPVIEASLEVNYHDTLPAHLSEAGGE